MKIDNKQTDLLGKQNNWQGLDKDLGRKAENKDDFRFECFCGRVMTKRNDVVANSKGVMCIFCHMDVVAKR